MNPETLRDWRHHLHQHPEAAFEEVQTAAFVAEKLRAMGYDVHENIGKTGVVATLSMGDNPRTIAIRADMDCLAMPEQNTFAHASRVPNRMHACGHDGHTVIALGTAAELAKARDFNGRVCFVFQGAEEPGLGAQAMLDDGLLERFQIDEIYGLHNMPGLPLGQIGSKAGAIMASEDNFRIRITGKGAHAARPHMSTDALLIAAETVLALQTIVARDLDPMQPAVISCTEIHTDGIRNVIPGSAEISGDTRSYDPATRALIATRIRAISESIAAMHGAECQVEHSASFEPTVNHPECHEHAMRATRSIANADNIDDNTPAIMASEDFGVFLQHIPGCFVFLGNGIDSAPLHNPRYDFNDALLPIGVRFFSELVRQRLV